MHFRRQAEAPRGLGRVGHQQSCLDREGQRGAAGAVAGTDGARGVTPGKFAPELGFAQQQENTVGIASDLGVDDADVVLDVFLGPLVQV